MKKKIALVALAAAAVGCWLAASVCVVLLLLAASVCVALLLLVAAAVVTGCCICSSIMWYKTILQLILNIYM